MTDDLRNFRKAVKEAIADSHKRGMPAYQCEKGYIIAIYPDGKKVRLQKSSPLSAHNFLCHNQHL